ncbi:hypothetical protein ACVIYL_005346 [Bradyrhizobium sp. USDA 3315]
MSGISNLLHHRLGRLDVLALGSLVATAEQEHDGFASTREIYPVAGAVIDPHLAHAFAHRFHIAWISEFETPDACADPGDRFYVG